ncbi:MAG: M3 family oligoendopeptidase [Nitrospirota bacterium]|nr:M3 family oligoendopeptidase [Nitrospirota bacterium]
MPQLRATLPEWNLDDLYRSLDDPAIETDLAEALRRAEGFEKAFRGRITDASIAPDTLHEALGELEFIHELKDRLLSYAYLLFAGDTSNPRHGAFMQKVQERCTAINRHLIFFELEWINLADDRASLLIKDPLLDRYRHYLENERRYRPHRLSEGEETILGDKADTGKNAFVRLFEEQLSGISLSLETGGESRKTSMEEALSLLYDADREMRASAAKAITAGLKENSRVLSYIFNVLVQDHASDDRLRSFPDPMSSRHMANEIDGGTVRVLLDCCRSNYTLVARYYALKRRILGLDRVYDYDRYAPVAADTKAFGFEEARETVLSSFSRFSPDMAATAKQFFDKRWIDAALRPGKRGGAFSHPVVPSVHPYILVNYTGRQRDVMTLAHELGHGVHQCLAAKQGYFHSQTPLTTAEMASVFGEMLVFHSLKERETDPKARLALLCGKIEDTIATVFRQVALTTFEEALHRARREEGELPPDRINGLWLEANRAMFGDSVALTDDYSCWWLYISHFIHAPFYCYAYAFGELLVMALYRRYLEEGAPFVPRYLALLESGGRDSPDRLLNSIGVNILDPGFWQGGVDIIAKMVAEAEQLAQ